MKGFDKHGRRVMFFQVGNIDPNQFKADDVYTLFYWMMEILMDSLDQCSVTGFVTISNCKEATMSHIGMFSNPVVAKKSTMTFQDAYPIRPKTMHLLNFPSIMEAVLNLVKSFMNDKMKQRMMIHSDEDLTKLVDLVGPDVLPEELGGTNGTLQDHAGM